MKAIVSHNKVLTAKGFVLVGQIRQNESMTDETVFTYAHPDHGELKVFLVHDSIFSGPKKQWFHGTIGGMTAKKLETYLNSLSTPRS